MAFKTSNSDILSGDKLFQKRARIVLPYLVRQAKAGNTIYYSDLAKETDIDNPRNLNNVLGFIGIGLNKLAKQTKKYIPPIQCIVVSKKDELPGEGIDGFITDQKFRILDKNKKRKIVDAHLTEIYLFSWDWVLKEFELKAVSINLDEELKKAKNIQGGGESVAHKKFKDFISENPQVLGLNSKLDNGKQEHILPSADKLDVLFTHKTLKIGVEVKSSISNFDDILRGLFQCVKYKHLIEAEQIYYNEYPNSHIILALQGEFPNKLLPLKNLFGIEVVDNIKMIN